MSARSHEEGPRIEHDVVVLGGGPAGAAAAILLARRGYSVALLRPDRPPAGALAQSIPPSAERLLRELDLVGYLEDARLHRNGGNTVWWAGREARVEAFDEGRSGWHLDRAGLEAILDAAADGNGVEVLTKAARSVEEREDGWTVRPTGWGGPVPELYAPWLLDATGRHGLVARTEGRLPDRSTDTTALVRRWRRAGGFADTDPTHTLVESYRDGWAWSVPLDAEVRCFTAMVDHRHVELAGGDLDASLEAELDKAARVGSARAGAEPVGPTWACPASLYTASRFARPGLLLVGDAGSFIDPLSSFGVKKALSSGWLAAITVHTALSDPTLRDVALGFFDQRERAVYRRYRARSAPFFAECAGVYGHEYWSARAHAAEAAAGPGSAGPDRGEDADPDALDGPGVPAGLARGALERIRSLPTLRAVRGRSLRTVDRAAIAGHRIAPMSHLASDAYPQGLRWVRNVDLIRLVEVAPEHARVPDGWTAYNAGAPPVALPDYLAALATAFAAGLLEHAEGPG